MRLPYEQVFPEIQRPFDFEIPSVVGRPPDSSPMADRYYLSLSSRCHRGKHCFHIPEDQARQSSEALHTIYDHLGALGRSRFRLCKRPLSQASGMTDTMYAAHEVNSNALMAGYDSPSFPP